MVVTYTAPFWSVADSDRYGYWKTWNGAWKGARYEWRQKTMEGCITNIGGCLKTKHPWIEVEMRANLAMTLNWNTKDDDHEGRDLARADCRQNPLRLRIAANARLCELAARACPGYSGGTLTLSMSTRPMSEPLEEPHGVAGQDGALRVV